MDYQKRGKVYDMVTIDCVSKCYQSPKPVSKEKKKDLMSLLPYIDESTHDFYRSLTCQNDLKDTVAYYDSDSD